MAEEKQRRRPDPTVIVNHGDWLELMNVTRVVRGPGGKETVTVRPFVPQRRIAESDA